MTTTKCIFISILTAVTVVGMTMSTASANEAYVEGHLATVNSTDDGFVNAAGDTGAGGLGVALGYELDMLDQIALRPLFIYNVQGFSGRRFGGDLRTEWGRQQLMLGADVGYDLLTWLRPMARLALGYSHQALVFNSGGERYRDSDHGMSGLAAAGVEFSLGRSVGDDPISRLSAGANLLFGYSFQTDAHFDDMTSVSAPDEPTDEDPWQRASYDADRLNASGFAFSLGVSVRYRF